MIQALLYKEYIKTRAAYALLAALLWGMCIYLSLNVHRIAGIKGAAHLWEVAISRDAIFVQWLKFVPLIAGILAGVAQFVPEMVQKRLKLTLHLPCSCTASAGTMLTYGAAALSAIYAVDFLILNIALGKVFAEEIVSRILMTALPWHLAGVTAYLLTAWVILEPAWKVRVFNMGISALLIRLFFLSDTPEAYNRFIPILAITAAVTASFPFISIDRFKAGRE